MVILELLLLKGPILHSLWSVEIFFFYTQINGYEQNKVHSYKWLSYNYVAANLAH